MSNPLFQTGTVARCRNGKPKYTAWWEEYPVNKEQRYADVVSPGDVMDVYVGNPESAGGPDVMFLSLLDYSATGALNWNELESIANPPPTGLAECFVERPTVTES